MARGTAGVLQRGGAIAVARRWFQSRPRLAFSVSTLVAFLAGWNADIEDPATGSDASWQAGLYMATRDGLDFGRDIAIQYGPLGFLKFPTTYDTGLAAVSFAYVVAVGVLTAGLLVWAAHMWSQRWITAGVMAAVAVSLLAEPRIWQLGGAAPVQVTAVVACAHVVRGDAPSWLGTALAFGGGVLVGIEVLGKINLAVLLGVMVVFALVVSPDRGRNLTRFGLAFAVTVTSAWFLTGQSVANVDDYVLTSVDIMRAWSQLGSTGSLDVSHLLALLATSIVLAASWLTTRGLATDRRIFLMALVAFFLLATFKSSFTLYGGGRIFIFFGSAVGVWFAFRWGAARMLPLASFGALVAMFFAAAAVVPPGDDVSTKTVAVGINPLNNRPTSLLDTISPDTGRARLRAEYELGARALSLIGDRPVHIFDEASLAWAYRLNWRPIPIFEPNIVNSSTLDRLNAASLESPGGPSRILRDVPQEAMALSMPVTGAAMLCRFRELYADSRWQVLARGPNRCEAESIVRRVSARSGETIRVPQVPGAVVRATIRGLEPGFLRVAANGFLPRRASTVTIDGESTSLQADKAAGGVILRAPTELDYAGAYRVSLQATTISFHRDITVEFRVQQVSGASAAQPDPQRPADASAGSPSS